MAGAKLNVSLTASALNAGTDGKDRAAGTAAVAAWTAAHADALSRAKSFLTALEATGELSVAKLTLAGSQIHELAAR